MMAEKCLTKPPPSSEFTLKQSIIFLDKQGVSVPRKGTFLGEKRSFAYYSSRISVARKSGNGLGGVRIVVRSRREKRTATNLAKTTKFTSLDSPGVKSDAIDNRTRRRTAESGKNHVHEPARVASSMTCVGEASTETGEVYVSRKSRSFVAGSRSPLTREEEQQFFSDVQDLLYLENRKAELNRKLERVPTDKEWADYIGCSICHLYARVGKGRAAKRKMIAANLPLVASVAKQFRGRGLTHQELCQEGALGLLKSIEKFNILHNTKFSTYSFFWIRERMSAAAKKFQHILMGGDSVRKTLSFVLQCKDDFREQCGRDPSIDELALASKIDKAKIRHAFSTIRPAKTLDAAPASSYQDFRTNALYTELQDPERDFLPWFALWESELKAELGRLFLVLSPREMQVLHMRYGLYGDTPQTFVQIATNLGVTHEFVRMAEKNALRKLRRSAEELGLQHYLYEIGRFSSR